MRMFRVSGVDEDTGTAKMLMALGISVLAFLILPGCVSPMRVSQTKEFALSADTPVTVVVQNDYAGVQGRVEAKLIELGLNVVPFEVAKKATESKQSTAAKEGTTVSKSTSQLNVYFPTALVVSVAYQARRDAVMEGFSFFNARFIDLATERVLAVASFSQGANWVSMDYEISSFGDEVSKYIKKP